MCDKPMGIEEEDSRNHKLHHALRCIRRSQDLGKEGKHRGEIMFLRAVVWDLLSIIGADNAEVQNAIEERAYKFLDALFRDMEDFEDEDDEEGEEI